MNIKNRKQNKMRRGIVGLICVLLFGMAGNSVAQQPHRVAVLVNENSQNSKKAANVFSLLHGVPGGNVIYLDLPESIVTGRAECSPAEFKTLIYDPAQKAIEERGLSGQVLAWVYSVDFPIRVVTSENDRQQMSIMGMTFLRGAVPDLEQMEKGQILSPLFAGPNQEGGPKNPTRSFGVLSSGLRGNMPLPSMMLGYIGEGGNDMETVIRCIQSGAQARKRNSGPRVLLVTTDDDNRSLPREWQFAEVKKEMATRGGAVVITDNQAPNQKDLMGVMTGAETVTPSDFGQFAPGAMAEHLTSWSAEFQKGQSKCTEWLAAGATVTAGMVTEPYNGWVKFPHARFYDHYARGCSAIESFYQSIFSPVQVLLLGDPLSQIISLPVQIEVSGLSKEITSDLDSAFFVEATFPIETKPVYSALLNGKPIKPVDHDTMVELPFDEMGAGYHEVRLIAQAISAVTPGGFKDVPVFINKKGRSVSITNMTDRDPQLIVASAEAVGEELPKECYLLWNDRELVRAAYGSELIFDERIIGEGPHRLQVVAVYEDGMEVRSAPQGVSIIF
jgi:uncharacterized protein (TIGR03790 family)